MSEYPEHDKLLAVAEESQVIGEFLDSGLARQGLHLYEREDIEGDPFHGVHEYPTAKPIDRILADYFDIDLNKIETEKRQMLAKLREQANTS